jgi:hypothetical protein
MQKLPTSWMTTAVGLPQLQQRLIREIFSEMERKALSTPLKYERDHLMCLAENLWPLIKNPQKVDITVRFLHNDILIPKESYFDEFTIYVKFEEEPFEVAYRVTDWDAMVESVDGKKLFQMLQWEERCDEDFVHTCGI